MPEEAVMDPPKKGATAQEKNAEYNRKTSGRKKRKEAAQRWVETAKISKVSYINSKVCITYSVVENNCHNEYDFASDNEPAARFSTVNAR